MERIHRIPRALVVAMLCALPALVAPIAAVDAANEAAGEVSFHADSIDFWYEQDGELYPARLFATYAVEPGKQPGDLGDFVETELQAQVADPGVTAAFSHTGGMWPGGRPPAFTINPNAAPRGLTHGQVIDAILLGADVWRYEGLEFSYAGVSKQFANVVRPDGRFTVSFGGNMPREAIGVAILWCIGCAGGPVEYDVQFRVGWAGWTYDQLVSTAAHEFGHVAGLGHEEKGCGERKGPIMCPAAGSVFPTEDDINGITALYGGDGPPLIPRPARFQVTWGYGKGRPTFGDPVFALNAETGAICGISAVKLEAGKPGFAVEVFGASRSRPLCLNDGDSIRFYFPEQKMYSSLKYHWREGSNTQGLLIDFASLSLRTRGRVGAVSLD